MSGIIASRNYSPGDLIYSEETFVRVLPRKLKDILCESCYQRGFALRACKQCLAVKYCGRSCQKNDWSTHRLECEKLKNLPDCSSTSTDIVRLLGKLILKIKGKDWKVVKKRCLGKDFSLNDIDTHYKEMTENPRLNLNYRELKDLTEKFLGKADMPSDLDFLKLAGKVLFNTFSPLSLAFCIGSNIFDMECIPNANLQLSGGTVKIWAIRKISKGIDKISIPARQILSLKTDRDRDALFCRCSDCSLPYGESILTKILDDKSAYSVIRDTESVLDLIAVVADSEYDLDLCKTVDEILKRQKGVLSNSNILRLRLLAFRCFKIGGHPLTVLAPLLELEKYMRSVFGEFYSEMLPIYQALSLSFAHLIRPVEAMVYMRKARIIEMYIEQ